MYTTQNYFEVARLMRIFVLVLMTGLIFATLAFAGTSEKTSNTSAKGASIASLSNSNVLVSSEALKD